MPSKTARNSVLVIAILASFMAPFMLSAINIALPAIEKQFNMDAVMLSWVVNSFLLSTAITLVPAGRLGDIYGRKFIFQWGIILFTFSSLGCGLSFTAEMLIGFRLVQGISAAMMMTTGAAILISAFPASQRGKVLGLNVAAVYLGLSLGPFAGGILTEQLGWQSIFITTVPIGILAVILILSKIKDEWADAQGERFDIAGTILYAIALTGIMYGASNLPEVKGMLFIAGGILSFVAFVYRQNKIEHPVFDIQLFKGNRVFAFSNIAALINYSATFAVTFLLSLYLQYIKAFNAQTAGTILVIQPILQSILSPVAGRLSDRIEPRIIASAGMGITATGLFLMIFLSAESPMYLVYINLALLGFGFALFSSPNMNTIMRSVKKRFYGLASGSASTMRLLGQMLSMTIATVAFAIFIGREQIGKKNAALFMESFEVIFIILTILCIIGIYFSLARGKLRK